ncbi:MAG TPA: hypothetical protein VFH51_13310, partial [Myxococcota bacterium]|nr:hypothetical protein [Myxococcota bacterium]
GGYLPVTQYVPVAFTRHAGQGYEAQLMQALVPAGEGVPAGTEIQWRPAGESLLAGSDGERLPASQLMVPGIEPKDQYADSVPYSQFGRVIRLPHGELQVLGANGARLLSEIRQAAERIDRDATTEQTKALRQLLHKPDMVELLTTLLRNKGVLPPKVIDVDCPAYKGAHEFVVTLDALASCLKHSSSEAELSGAYKRLAAGRQILETALAIAEGDALSARYDSDTWVGEQAIWRRALKELDGLESDAILQKRDDHGQAMANSVTRWSRDNMKRLGSAFASLSTDKIKAAAKVSPLFDVAPLPQQVGLLLRTITGDSTSRDQQKVCAEKLGDLVRDMRHTIVDIEKELDDHAPLGVVLRKKRRDLIDLIGLIDEQNLTHLDKDLKKQLEKARDRGLYARSAEYDPRPGEWENFEVPPPLPDNAALVAQGTFRPGGPGPSQAYGP